MKVNRLLIKYKKVFEKTAMGLLSYLPDFKNLKNLQDEMKLYDIDDSKELYLYQDDEHNIVGIVGVELCSEYIVLCYLSLAPGFRDDKHQGQIMNELAKESSKRKIMTVPEYTSLMKYLKNE